MSLADPPLSLDTTTCPSATPPNPLAASGTVVWAGWRGHGSLELPSTAGCNGADGDESASRAGTNFSRFLLKPSCRALREGGDGPNAAGVSFASSSKSVERLMLFLAEDVSLFQGNLVTF